MGGEWRVLGGEFGIWGIAQRREDWSVGGNLISEAGKTHDSTRKIHATGHVFHEMCNQEV